MNIAYVIGQAVTTTQNTIAQANNTTKTSDGIGKATAQGLITEGETKFKTADLKKSLGKIRNVKKKSISKNNIKKESSNYSIYIIIFIITIILIVVGVFIMKDRGYIKI
jgi:CHASE3 domain sensor protein